MRPSTIRRYRHLRKLFDKSPTQRLRRRIEQCERLLSDEESGLNRRESDRRARERRRRRKMERDSRRKNRRRS